MPPVEFEEQEFTRSQQPDRSGHGALTNLILKLGLAKSPSQANIVMVVIVVIAVALTVYLLLPSSAAAPEAAAQEMGEES